MANLKKIGLSLAASSMLLSAATNLDVRLGNEKWQLIGVNGCYDPLANVTETVNLESILSGAQKEFKNGKDESIVKITNEYGKVIEVKVPNTINPDDNIPERMATVTLTNDEGNNKIIVEYSTAATNEEILITIDSQTYALSLASNDSATVLLSSLSSPAVVQCDITASFRSNLAVPENGLGIGDDTLQIYSYDTFNTNNTNWLSYSDENEHNDFSELEIGKGYWVKRSGLLNFNNNYTGFRFSQTDIPKNTYSLDKTNSGWNLVSFNNSQIRESSTGLIVKFGAKNDTLILTDVSGEYSTDPIIITDINKSHQTSREINGAIKRAQILGKLPNDFNIKAFAHNNNDGTIVLISDNKFKIDIFADTTILTTLGGESFTNGEYTKYGEYALAIKNNINNKFIQINDNEPVEFDRADLTKIIADPNIDNAFGIKDAIGNSLYILVDKDSKFTLKDHTFTRLIKANNNITPKKDLIFQVNEEEVIFTANDKNEAKKLYKYINAIADIDAEQIIATQFIKVTSTTKKDFTIIDNKDIDLFTIATRSEIERLPDTKQKKLKGAITKAYSLSSLAKLSVSTGVDLNGDGDTDDTLSTLSETSYDELKKKKKDLFDYNDDDDFVDVVGLDERKLNFDFNGDGDKNDIVTSINETKIGADFNGDNDIKDKSVKININEATIDLNNDGIDDGFDLNGNGNKTDVDVDILVDINENDIYGDKLSFNGNITTNETIKLKTGFYEAIVIKDDDTDDTTAIDDTDLARMPAKIDFTKATPITDDITYSGIQSPDFITANNPLLAFDRKVLRIYGARSNNKFAWQSIDLTVDPKNLYEKYDYSLYQFNNSYGYWVYLGDEKGTVDPATGLMTSTAITIAEPEIQLNCIHSFNNGVDSDNDGDYEVNNFINTNSYIQATITGITYGSVELKIGKEIFNMRKLDTSDVYKTYIGSFENKDLNDVSEITITAYDGFGNSSSKVIPLPVAPSTPELTIANNSITIAAENATDIYYYNSNIDEVSPTPTKKFTKDANGVFVDGIELYSILTNNKKFGDFIEKAYFVAVNGSLADNAVSDIAYRIAENGGTNNIYFVYKDSYVLGLDNIPKSYDNLSVETVETENNSGISIKNIDGTDPTAKIAFAKLGGIVDTNVPLETWVTDDSGTKIKILAAREYVTNADNKIFVKLNNKVYLTTFSKMFDADNNDSTDGKITAYSESNPINVTNAIFEDITAKSGQNDL